MTVQVKIDRKRGRIAAKSSARPYKTYYPGMLRVGHCLTAASAMRAAYNHLLLGEERRATVEGPSGEVAWLTWTPLGITTRMDAPTRTALRPKANLRRVK